MMKTSPKSTFSGSFEMPIRRVTDTQFSTKQSPVFRQWWRQKHSISSALVPSLSADPMKLKKQVEKYQKIPSHFLQFKVLTIMLCKSLRWASKLDLLHGNFLEELLDHIFVRVSSTHEYFIASVYPSNLEFIYLTKIFPWVSFQAHREKYDTSAFSLSFLWLI